MKIEQSSLQTEGMALAWQHTRQSTSIQMSFAQAPATPAPAETRSDISSAGLSTQPSPVAKQAKGDEMDPRLKLLVAIIEALTGRKIELFNADEVHSEQQTPAASRSGISQGTPTPEWSVRIERSQVHEALEFAIFSARGQVSTADGRQINFALDLKMQRYERQESSSVIEAGNRPKAKDPLVLNLNTDQARLSAGSYSFDLNLDGQAEKLATLAAGSAYLALDRNQNGRIDNGSELFGPQSGEGFSELSELDADQNGWIDENDAVFDQLKLWRPGDSTQSLQEGGVGAIALEHRSTPFSLKDSGKLLGSTRSSGVFLTESGQARSIQQVDLVI